MMYKSKVLVSIVSMIMMALLPFSVFAQIYTSVNITSVADLNAYGPWPITISGGSSENPVVIKLSEDITLTDVSNYFVITGDYVTFDGNNHTININTGSTYQGLIKNGSFSNLINGYSNITIKNIVVISSASDMLNNTAGWIGQDSFGYKATNIIIDNCHSNYSLANTNSGGIVGRYSPAMVSNCSSSGPIATGGGGICGKYFSGTVINCYSSGAIGTNAGGIIGSFSTGTAINCYSTGSIGNSAGGIMGSDAGNDGTGTITTVTATNCFSRGNIIGTNAGGIMSQKSRCNVTNCYSTGTIGSSAGGIVGYQCSGNITNCYTIGTLTGSGERGITGTSFVGSINDCLSSYSNLWSDSDASSVLTGTDGTVWIGRGSEQPFILASNASIINTVVNFGSFTTYSGAPSNTQTMMVSGTSLKSAITVSVPDGYEISTSPAGIFYSTLSLLPRAGILETSTLYVRLTNNVVNEASGNIAVASDGFITKSIAIGTAILQSASVNLYGSKTVSSTTYINKNGAIGVSGVSANGGIILYLPTLSATSEITAINANTALSGGVVLSDGGSPIIRSGVCWSSFANPTIADNKTSDGTSLSFTSNLTNLIAGTTYYVRDYATNGLGTSYGVGVSFIAL